MCTLVFFVFCFVNCSDNALVVKNFCVVKLTCFYIFYANSNQASLNSSSHDPLTDYFRLKSIPTLFTEWFQLHVISSRSIQIRIRPEKFYSFECTVNTGNSRGKKILCCENFSVQKTFFQAHFSIIDLKQHF